MSLLVADNKVVSIHYTLTDSNGDAIDSSRGGKPLAYLHGAGNIIPGLENALTGKSAGDTTQVVVEPEAGYGMRLPELVKVVPRSMFEGVDDIQPGMQFQAESPSGGAQLITVMDVDGNDVTIDTNHPLAGKTLHFDVTVEAVREATAEETSHGYAH